MIQRIPESSRSKCVGSWKPRSRVHKFEFSSSVFLNGFEIRIKISGKTSVTAYPGARAGLSMVIRVLGVL
jgi:hypothetical protein